MKIEKTHEELSITRRKLAQEYRRDLEELAEIQKRKAFKIIELRAEKDIKSDKQAERLFATTEDGQRELELHFKAKGMIELIRCLKTEIDIKNSEAFNQY